MRYLFNNWKKLRNELNGKKLLLFLDYDGTLAPIAKRPQDAFIPLEAKKLLERLSRRNNCKLVIVSGRALQDVERMVGIRKIIYAGNHGLEIEGLGLEFKNPVSLRSKKILEKIKDDLRKKLRIIEGTLLEDKGLTLSIHYRLVAKDNLTLLKRLLKKALAPYLARKKIRVTYGKRVFELRPPVDWNKGKAVLWFLHRDKLLFKKYRAFPVYIGDDITDEDAFKIVKKRGLSVFVGKPRKSYAEYFLRNPKDVLRLLKKLCLLI